MGSRTLVHAALADLDLKGSKRIDGRYLSSCRVEEESDFAISEEGRESEMRIWVRIYLSVLIVNRTDFF